MLTKQGLHILETKLDLALNLLSEHDLDTFDRQCQVLEDNNEEYTGWINEDLQEFFDDNEVEVDIFSKNKLSPKDLALKIQDGMEYDGLIGYFHTYYKVFKALFAKHPELLVEGDIYDYENDDQDK